MSSWHQTPVSCAQRMQIWISSWRPGLPVPCKHGEVWNLCNIMCVRSELQNTEMMNYVLTVSKTISLFPEKQFFFLFFFFYFGPYIYITLSQHGAFLFLVTWVWNDIRVIKYWKNFHFGVNNSKKSLPGVYISLFCFSLIYFNFQFNANISSTAYWDVKHKCVTFMFK